MLESRSHRVARSARRSVLLMVAFGAAWALLEITLGSRLGSQYDLMQVVWCRYATHVALLLLIFGWRAPASLLRTRRPAFHLARSLLMFIMPFSFVLSLRVGTAPDLVWAIFWCSPLLVLGLARAFLKEKVAAVSWLLACLGTAASLVVLRPPVPATAASWLFPLAMALSFSAYLVMTRSLRGESLRVNLFYTAAGVLAALTPVVPDIWITPTLRDAVVLFGIGAVGLIALLMLDRAMANAPVAVSAPVLPFQLVCVVLLAHRDRIVLGSMDLVLAVLVIAGLSVYTLYNAGAISAAAMPSAAPSDSRAALT